MKPNFCYSIILLFSSMNFFSGALAQLKIDAQYRNRFEIRDGYRELSTSNTTPAVIISQRFRLSLNYQTEFLKFRFTPQDVRIWGDEQLTSATGVYGDQASLDLFEGYVELKTGNCVWLSIGRQQLVYDNQRLLAARNWNQLGISYDAVLAKITMKEWNLHVAGSWNTLSDALAENTYPVNRMKSLNFIWLNRIFNEKLRISLLHIVSGSTKTDTTNTLRFRQTTGLYSNYKAENINIWGNAYYQFGQNRYGQNVNACLIDADASLKSGDFNSGIGIGYLSGNARVATEQTADNLFDLLYGARHRYFGNMDYFSNFSNHTNQGGFVDFYFYITYNFSESLSIKNIGHYFRLAQTNASTPSDKNLGYENDIVLNLKLNEWGTLESGYAFILPTETLKTIQGISEHKLSQFFYLQLTVKPTILSN